MSNKNIIDTYKNIYNLSELTYKEEVDFDFLDYVGQSIILL